MKEKDNMVIVLLCQWHSEQMGYSDNFLPKALASLGHDVHLVATNGQVHFNTTIYKNVFEPFLGPQKVKCGIKKIDGYTLHRLPCLEWRGKVGIKGFNTKIFSIKPDIVQSGGFLSLVTYQAAFLKLFMQYKFFVECHIHASVFSPVMQKPNLKEKFYWPVYASTIGRFVNTVSEKCYPISLDAADIAIRFLGVDEHKIKVVPLGVDTDIFKPISNVTLQENRLKVRRRFGFSDSDIVCIYTGRFSRDKDSLCLAKAIAGLRAQNKPFRGLFIGDGAKEYIDTIKSYTGCVVHPFMSTKELPDFYRASDIGVWPKQESTSQLDATASGLPIILSDRVKVRERIEGNGLLYEEGSTEDMISKLMVLSDSEVRRQLGENGSRKMREQYSWKRIAEFYVQDYREALKKQR